MAMKWKNLILSALFIWGVMPVASVVALDAQPSANNTVHAVTKAEAEKEAEKQCNKPNIRFKESCKKGYVGAVTGKPRGKSCEGLTGGSLEVCRDKWDANAPDSAPDPDESCPEGAVKVSPALGGGCYGEGGENGQNPIFAFLSYAITFVTAAFGLVLVFVIVISGFQYILGAADSDNVKGAKDRLKAAATGLILFVLMYSVLQLLLPSDVSIFK